MKIKYSFIHCQREFPGSKEMSKSRRFFQKLIKPFVSKSSKDQSELDLEKIAAQEQNEFSFETLVAATKNFDPNQKLGEGGFGPVFKGQLDDGREIAVKKLSQCSAQGAKEFQIESKLLARVHHKNVVTLLGYCVHGREQLLVYQYVVNESLDKLLFTSNGPGILDWSRRYGIILGVAKGLFYLHEESHCGIIHRDIKAGNILLDDKWVPKIADFGMARLYPEDQTHVKTRVAGTNGYMAPEYVMHGHLSEKADVFSFGVVVLELISGQKNSKFKPDSHSRSMLEWVDLTGGYYDAGDNVKFGFPMAFTTTLLSWSVIDFGRNMGGGELGNAVKAVKWGTDYLLKATAHDGVVFVQVGDPLSDHNCWERPEDMDTLRTAYRIDANNPGSDVAGETAAALAAASIVFRSRDPAYSRLLLNRAIKVFEFADRHRGAYSSSLRYAVCPFYCDVNGYEDELLWGAAWLHKASRRREYREYIVRNEVVLRAGDSINEFGWDNKHAGINVLLSKEVVLGKAKDLKQFRINADGFICSLLPGKSNTQVQYSPGGLIFKAGGSNMQHVTSLSFLLLAYSNYLSHANRAVPCGGHTYASPALLKRLAKRQVDYILGDNPLRMSYMVGYGPHYPQRIHHRASSLPSLAAHPTHISCKAGSRYFFSPNPNPNVLVGALVGGPNSSDAFPDSRPFFQESEPTTYINAPLVGLLAYFSAHP